MRSDARANRERILASAEEAFGEHGPDLSTDEVARRAGVGVATVFRHFPTKRDLLEAALVRHFEELERRVVAAEDRESPGAAVRDLVADMVPGGAVKVALVGELMSEDGRLVDAAAEVSGRVRRRFGALLGRAQESGEIRPDLDIDAIYHLIRALSAVPASASSGRALEVLLDGMRPLH